MRIQRLPRWFQYLLGSFLPAKPAEKIFYLTFDDGPTPHTAELIELLGFYHFQATFFWVWSRYREGIVSPEQLWRGGHTVGLHGETHLSGWRKARLPSELRKSLYLWQRLGYPVIAAYRPPYGHVGKHPLPSGFRLVLWDVMPPDYLFTGGWEDALLRSLRRGDVVVLHERKSNWKAWERFFSACAAAGWQAKALPLATVESPLAPFLLSGGRE